MKTLFIPSGTIMRHESVDAQQIIVKGTLLVDGDIRAKRITGDGTIAAAKIIARDIRTGVLEADEIVAKKVIADKIFCDNLYASVGIIARDYIEADEVRTHRITMTCSDIDKLDAREIVRVQPQHNSFLWMLFLSWCTERFAIWRNDRITEAKAFEAPPVVDEETERTLEEYRHMCAKGYRLVLEPAAPEEPVNLGISA